MQFEIDFRPSALPGLPLPFSSPLILRGMVNPGVYFLANAGRLAMDRTKHGFRLRSPKCYGRALRSVVSHYVALTLFLDGRLSSGCLTSIDVWLDYDRGKFEKRLHRHAPRLLRCFLPIATDFHLTVAKWRSADAVDIARLHGHARRLGFFDSARELVNLIYSDSWPEVSNNWE